MCVLVIKFVWAGLLIQNSWYAFLLTAVLAMRFIYYENQSSPIVFYYYLKI